MSKAYPKAVRISLRHIPACVSIALDNDRYSNTKKTSIQYFQDIIKLEFSEFLNYLG